MPKFVKWFAIVKCCDLQIVLDRNHKILNSLSRKRFIAQKCFRLDDRKRADEAEAKDYSEEESGGVPNNAVRQLCFLRIVVEWKRFSNNIDTIQAARAWRRARKTAREAPAGRRMRQINLKER